MRSIVLALLVSAVCIAQDLPAPDQVVVEPDQPTTEAHWRTGAEGTNNKASTESLQLINFLDGQLDTGSGWSASPPAHAPWAAASLAAGSGELRAAVNWNVGFTRRGLTNPGSRKVWLISSATDFSQLTSGSARPNILTTCRAADSL
ncbi:MAG: hypothetical protein JO270_23135 [Acidobacteriaceae bacterium]|nr:hypothetical protein [Acidobacteriaceae bacterium]